MPLRRGHSVFFLLAIERGESYSMLHHEKYGREVGAMNPAREHLKRTHGEVFSDGAMIELVRGHGDPASLALLLWEGRHAVIGGLVRHDGKAYTPPSLDPTLSRSMRLPSEATPYGSTRELFTGITDLAIHYCRVPEDAAAKIAFFVFGGWLIEKLDFAPLLSVVAPPGSAKNLLLRLLSLICRRPLILADTSASTLRSLPTPLAATFLFDEAILTPRTERMIAASLTRGRLTIRAGRAIDNFSAKVICSPAPLGPALACKALQIMLPPTSGQLPIFGDDALEQVAKEYQAKLLLYRLTNYTKVVTPQFDVGALTPPVQEVARALASCITADEQLQQRVVSLLSDADCDFRTNQSSSLEAAILEGLIFCCHDPQRPHVLCGQLADIVNTLWTERGDDRRTTPESVGWKLRSVGLRTSAIGAKGHGLDLTDELKTRVHKLAYQHGVTTLARTAKTECENCARTSAR